MVLWTLKTQVYYITTNYYPLKGAKALEIIISDWPKDGQLILRLLAILLLGFCLRLSLCPLLPPRLVSLAASTLSNIQSTTREGRKL